MRKIIGFKLNLRPTEIQRRAKKAGAASNDPEKIAERIPTLISEASAVLKPAVLFDTFPHADLDQKQLSPLRGVAFSVIIATIGEGLKEVPDMDPADAALKPLIEAVALEECLHFAAGLIAEEAGKESCELSPLNALTETKTVEIALGKLDGSKIGVRLEAETLVPAASRAVTLSWLSKGKARLKSAK